MIEKSKRKPKFQVRRAQPLRPLRALARLPAPLRPLPHLLPRAGAGRDDPGRAQGKLVARACGACGDGAARPLDARGRRPSSPLATDSHSHIPPRPRRIREERGITDMSMTDPIADMLTRIRNACGSKHRRVDMPVSKMKTEIARILKENNYIQDYRDARDRGWQAACCACVLKYAAGRPAGHPRAAARLDARAFASTSASPRSRACATASAWRS